jgi:hypothetical protein
MTIIKQWTWVTPVLLAAASLQVGCGRQEEHISQPSQESASQQTHPFVLLPDPQAPHAFSVVLLSGFQGNIVRIRIDEREVFRGQPVDDPIAGPAYMFAYRTRQEQFLLDVRIPAQGITFEQLVNLASGQNVGLHISRDGEMKLIQSSKGFAFD